MTEFTIEDYIYSLPEDVTDLDVRFNKLTYLTNLSYFTKLRTLNCSCNQLTSLPNLPINLHLFTFQTPIFI